MFKKLLYVRYLFVIVVIFMMLNSVFFIIGGVIESVEGMRILISHGLDCIHDFCHWDHPSVRNL
jgi:hypothetical protein